MIILRSFPFQTLPSKFESLNFKRKCPIKSSPFISLHFIKKLENTFSPKSFQIHLCLPLKNSRTIRMAVSTKEIPIQAFSWQEKLRRWVVGRGHFRERRDLSIFLIQLPNKLTLENFSHLVTIPLAYHFLVFQL